MSQASRVGFGSVMVRCAVVAAIALSCTVARAQTLDFHVPGGDLKGALDAYARQSGMQIVYRESDVRGLVTRGVDGALPVKEALSRILNGTSLTVQSDSSGAIAIVPLDSERRSVDTAAVATGAGAGLEPRYRLAQAASDETPAPSGAQEPAGQPAARFEQPLEEVVVTSNKIGVQLLQDVPAGITVIDQTRIVKAGIVDFLDYVRTIPGLGFQLTTPAGGRDDIRGGRRFALRGIESGFDSVPTTAFYLDEAPIPIMDPNLFDVSRVEVLRGPQGTLYGANSMGGTIRVVTNRAVLNEVQYAGDLSLESTRAGEESYSLDGMINIPLVSDKVALRAAAFFRNDGGFIDRVLELPPSVTATNTLLDVNSSEIWGARLTATLQLTDRLRLVPSVFRQEIKVDDAANYEPDFRDLSRHFKSVRATEQSNDFTLYSLEASYDITDRLQLVSASAYFESNLFVLEDDTKGFFDFGGEGYGAGLRPNVVENERKSQELRLAYNGERFRGVVGAFYMDEDRLFDQYATTETAVIGDGGVWFTYFQTNGDEQRALFGEGTFDLTDRLSITGGVRWFEGKQDQYTFFTYSLDLEPGDPIYQEEFRGEGDGTSVSPKLQISYDLSDDKMVYTTATRGFRPGGPSSPVPAQDDCLEDLAELGLDRPQTEFDPDTLWNFEVGTKASFADRRLTTNIAAYFIDWKDVQQTASLECGYSFVGNVGAARSKGIELEFWADPSDRLAISGSLGYTDAEFTRTEPTVGVVAGDRIPLVPELTGSLAAEYSFTMPTGHSAFLRGDYQYIDAIQQGGFFDTRRPAYDSLDLRLGMDLTDRTELALFVNNVFDERGVLSINDVIPGDDEGGIIPAPFLREQTVVRPRTVGITFRYRH